MNVHLSSPLRKLASTKTAFAGPILSERAGAGRKLIFVLALAGLLALARTVSAQGVKPDGNGGPGSVQTETSLGTSGSPSIYLTSVTFNVTVVPGSCANGVEATVYDNGAWLGTVTLNSGGMGSLTTSSLAAGSYSITASFPGNIVNGTTCLSSTSNSVNQVVSSRPGYEGLLLPKFVILDVIYAPPGCEAPCAPPFSHASTAQYSNSTTAGNTSSNSSSFSNQVQYSMTTGLSGNIINGKSTSSLGGISVTQGSSQSTTQTSSSSNTITLSKAAAASDTVEGFPTGYQPSGIPAGDHMGDWDVVELWLNPVLDFMSYPAYEGAPPAIQWVGYAWDPGTISGNNSFGGIFHPFINVGCLNGDWESDGNSQHASTCGTQQENLYRMWASAEDQNLVSPVGQGPLGAYGCNPQTANSPSICPNTQDAYQILQADPLAYSPGGTSCAINPATPPQTACNGQYTQLCWYPGNQPNSSPTYVCPNEINYATPTVSPGFNLTYIDTQTQTYGDSTQIASTVSTSYNSSVGFLALFGLSSTYTQTNTVTQTTSYQDALNQTQTVVDQYLINPDSPTYGTPDYLVYQDNFFGTFAFVPYNP